MRVVITDCNFPSVEIERAELAAIGARVDLYQCQTEDDVLTCAGDADALIVQYAPITRRVLEGLPRLRVVSRYGIGVDNIDVRAATALGVWVANVPGFCVPEASDHTLALLLACARRLCLLERTVRAGEWETVRVAGPTPRLSEQTLGLIGFGSIGRAVAQKARVFGLRVLAYSPRTTPELAAAYGAERADLERLLRESDYVSLHCPLTPETRHLLNAERLALMKPTAFLINTARGALVDEAALIAALKSGRLAGAALDVLEREPPAPDNPLLRLPNVIITPHAAWYSSRSLETLQRTVARNVAAVLRGEPPLHPVNPEVQSRLRRP